MEESFSVGGTLCVDMDPKVMMGSASEVDLSGRKKWDSLCVPLLSADKKGLWWMMFRLLERCCRIGFKRSLAVVLVVVVIVKLCLGGGGCRGSDDSLLYLLLVSDGKSLFYLSEVNQV